MYIGGGLLTLVVLIILVVLFVGHWARGGTEFSRIEL